MTSFHTDLRALANSNIWNELPSETSEIGTKHENISHAAFSCLRIEENKEPTFSFLAGKAVGWIKEHAGEITKEDEELINKLRAIFLKRLQPDDKCIKHLFEVSPTVSFHSITRNLDNCDELLAEGQSCANEVEVLCAQLNKGNWSAIKKIYVEKNLDNLPTDGLKAFYEKKITMEQFSTLMIFWSLVKNLPSGKEIQMISIFDQNDSVNPNAERIIRQTLQQSGNFRGGSPFLTDEQFAVFIENMRKQPASEHTFFSLNQKNLLRLMRSKQI